MNPPFVINLGLPKSGTTTLQTALQQAGLRVLDHLMPGPGRRPVARALYDGYFANGDPLARLPDVNVLGEISVLRPGLSLWPQMDFGLIQAIRGSRPDTRFVATWRPYADIVDSMARWRNLGSQRIPNGAIPGLPAGYGDRAAQLRWVAAHDAFLTALFDGDGGFLRLDMGAPEAPEKLATHIGCALPWWGRANVNTRGAA